MKKSTVYQNLPFPVLNAGGKREACHYQAVCFILTALIFFAGFSSVFAAPPFPAFGGDTVQDLFSPDLAGQGSFVTSTGSAPFSAINPAQAGQSDRMILNLGALGVTDWGVASELGGVLDIGLIYPTRTFTFGGTLRYYYFDQFENDFPLRHEFGGNFSVAREIFPEFSLGAGINFGLGGDTFTLSADIGILHNLGNLGFMKNFAWAFVLRNMGISWAPTWFTPWAGVTFDFLQLKGAEGRPSPLVLNFAFDVGVPSVVYAEKLNLILKAGITATIAEMISLSVLWPGAAGYNMNEAKSGNPGHLQYFPSIGMGINFLLPSGANRQSRGRNPSDGDLTFDAAFKPLYNDVYAVGAGLTWYVGYNDDLPPNVIVYYPEVQYFSPNNDGKADYLEFPVRIVDDHYVMSWNMIIKDSSGNIVRTYKNADRRYEIMDAKDIFGRYYMVRQEAFVPSTMQWDGVFDSGENAPDGKYYFYVSATDQNNNIGISPTYEVVLRNNPPQVVIDYKTDNEKIFDPSGGSGRTSITIVPHGTEEDNWESGIYDSEGKRIKTFASQRGRPQPQVWDGTTDTGDLAQDGVYTYRISATDRAFNTGSDFMSNIILDTRTVNAFLTSSSSAIAPKPNRDDELVFFQILLTRKDGIESWKIELKDDDGNIIKSFQGRGNEPPEYQGWNGLNDHNTITEGWLHPELTVDYLDGHTVSAKSTPILVNSTGPKLSLSYHPELFSPDGDGINDSLFINLGAESLSPIANWSLEIFEPYSVNGAITSGSILGNSFKKFEGKSNPTGELIWDGRSGKGELVQSAVEYRYVYTATDELGNSSSITGSINIDVLVIRDGNKFRIQIPSIVFPPDSAVFDGLNQSTLNNNYRVIQRLVQVLNKYKGYAITVEGHANPTTEPGPERERERPELRTLSEKRAGFVMQQLIRNGVSAGRLTFIGVGDANPVAAFEDHANWWKNRRVDFILNK